MVKENYWIMEELVNDAAFRLDKNLQVTFSNTKGFDFTGFNETELYSKEISEFIDSACVTDIKSSLSRGSTQLPVEYHTTLIMKGGSKRSVVVKVNNMRDDESQLILIVEESTSAEKSNSEIAQLNRQLEKIISGYESDKRKLSRELHDGIGQLLTVSLMYLKQLLFSVDPDTINLAKKSVEVIEKVMDEVRSVSNRLMPTILEDFGLELAVKNLVNSMNDKSDKTVVFNCKENFGRLASDVEIGLFRIIQKALDNSIQHSMAKSITVSIQKTSKSICLVVEDDGIGFASEHIGYDGYGNSGIGQMICRAELIDCEFDIFSNDSDGTKVNITYYLPPK